MFRVITWFCYRYPYYYGHKQSPKNNFQYALCIQPGNSENYY